MIKRKSVVPPLKLVVTYVSDSRSDWKVGDTITFGEGLFKPLSRWQRIKARIRKILVT